MKMTEQDTSHYWVTIEIYMVDSFGVQKFYKKEINFVVVHVAYPNIFLSNQ